MFGHPNKHEEFPSGANGGLLKAVEHSSVVALVVEQLLPTIATSHGMVDCPEVLDPKRSSHEDELIILLSTDKPKTGSDPRVLTPGFRSA
jgi:hypothetical protein